LTLFAHRKPAPLPLYTFNARERVTSSFEDWCETQGIHPEAFGAWESFEATAAAVPATDVPVDLGRGPVIA
jgi:hypothetical protein